MKKFIKNGFLAIFLFASSAHAGTVVVPYTFTAGQKAVAQEVNDDFSAVVNFLNGPNIASENIAALGITEVNLADQAVSSIKIKNNTIIDQNVQVGGLTQASIATTDGSFLYNRRSGCRTQAKDAKSLSVILPCDLVVDGHRGVLTATVDVSILTATEDSATVMGGYNYLYGKPNVQGGIDFKFSPQAPDLAKGRKITDPTKRYIGSVRTAATTIDIVNFTHGSRPNEYRLNNSVLVAFTYSSTTLSGAPTSYNLSVPPFANNAIFDVTGNSLGASTTCILQSDPAGLLYWNESVIDDAGGVYTWSIPFPGVPIFTGGVLFLANYSGAHCGAMSLNLRGYSEPVELYQ